MKILCLHAMGTSGEILKKQLAPIQHAIGGEHAWVFVDGPYEHKPHSTVRDRFDGPYFCYHETLSARDQADAHAFLDEVIEEDGPFDGVIGFSQGASLVTSYLLQHNIDHPQEPRPFAFAILFNANLVVSPDEHFCEDEILQEAARSQKSNRFGLKGSRKSVPDILSGRKGRLQTISKHRVPGKKSEVTNEVIGLLQLSLDAAESEGWIDGQTALEGKTVDDFPRIVHPMMLDTRIDIPTAIITGRQDSLFLCSLVQKRLCTKGLRNFVVHAEGHDIPRAGPALDMAAGSCKWAINQAQIAMMGGSTR